MKTLTRNETAALLRTQDDFCILTHRRPDGDTVGSAAALCRILRGLGKTAFVLENPEVTPRFSWLLEGLTKAEAAEGDTLVTVDVASPGMLPKAFAHLADKALLRIDHHGTATSFTEYELVDPHAAACAEIIYDLLAELGLEMDPQTADAVYTATSTDTGCFRFSNTTAHTFAVAAACADAGARVYPLNQALFETNSLTKLKIQSWMVEHMRLYREGKVALVAIPRSVELAIGVTDDDMDNISNFPRTIAGVCMAATLRETADGETKISVRAIPGWDAAAVCARFGGGGHVGAAGASVHMPIEEAAKALEAAMLEA